jgi:hypothetical protein
MRTRESPARQTNGASWKPARLAFSPVAVTHLAATIDGAVSGAAGKLRNALESTLGRRLDHKGSASIRKIDEQ